MKAFFTRADGDRLGIRFEPVSFEEQLLLEQFARYAEPGHKFRWLSWEHNHPGRSMREGLTSCWGQIEQAPSEPPRSEPQLAAAPVCDRCNDTHVMPFQGSTAACTSCPIPCDLCRGGTTAYCENTPCACKCHRIADTRFAAYRTEHASAATLKIDPAPRPVDDTSRRSWRAQIAGYLQAGDRHSFERHEFVPCNSCGAKTGSPTLCGGCLANRQTIDELRELVEKKRGAK